MLSQRRRSLLARLGRRAQREREGLYVAEGIRCATTVLDAGAEVRFALLSRTFTREDRALLERLDREGVERVVVPDEEFAAVAATRTPQGVLLVAVEPPPPPRLSRPTRALVLDAVQDPGNVGTLVRVAAGFGLSAVLTLDGTADPYAPKAVRASAGYVAALPVIRCRAEDAREILGVTPLLAADGGGDDVDVVVARDAWALVLGNEGAGVRAEILARAAHRVAVPVAGDVDSLNVGVAGAILLFALTRSRPTDG